LPRAGSRPARTGTPGTISKAVTTKAGEITAVMIMAAGARIHTEPAIILVGEATIIPINETNPEKPEQSGFFL
jgi:hypothetical protein